MAQQTVIKREREKEKECRKRKLRERERKIAVGCRFYSRAVADCFLTLSMK